MLALLFFKRACDIYTEETGTAIDELGVGEDAEEIITSAVAGLIWSAFSAPLAFAHVAALMAVSALASGGTRVMR